MLPFSHGIAGVYSVGTLSEARGRGHATRSMCSVSNRAFELGALRDPASETLRRAVYRKLGESEFTRYLWFLAAQ